MVSLDGPQVILVSVMRPLLERPAVGLLVRRHDRARASMVGAIAFERALRSMSRGPHDRPAAGRLVASTAPEYAFPPICGLCGLLPPSEAGLDAWVRSHVLAGSWSALGALESSS